MGSYEVSVEQGTPLLLLPSSTSRSNPAALTSALSLLKSYPPANGVLLRGGKELAPAIQKLADAGIMTVARMGACTSALKLHSVFALESTTTEGNAVAGDGPVCVARTLECARELLADAQALDGAGVGAVVLEGVAAAAAQKMGAVLMAPAIGLGSGRECAGQFVVQSELLGMRIGERVWAK